jgi:hypothetical protein
LREHKHGARASTRGHSFSAALNLEYKLDAITPYRASGRPGGEVHARAETFMPAFKTGEGSPTISEHEMVVQ